MPSASRYVNLVLANFLFKHNMAFPFELHSLCRGFWKHDTTKKAKYSPGHPFELTHTTELLDNGNIDTKAIKVHLGHQQLGYLTAEDAHFIIDHILVQQAGPGVHITAMVRDKDTTHSWPGFALSVLIEGVPRGGLEEAYMADKVAGYQQVVSSRPRK